VDTSAFRPLFSAAEKSAERTRLGLPDVPTCICTANLSAVKRHDRLLSAFALARAAVPEARLLLAGRDDSGGRVASLAKRLGVADAVELLGPRSDLPRLLPACDIGVLASETEGLPNSILEYMAAGLAVVSTDVGGVGEAVEAGVSALLVPPDDEAALGGAIAELLGDTGRAVETGAAGRRRAEERFDMGDSVRAHAALYLRLLGGAG
jgi:glycosyltransferase involved in cell wall biosynthesis